MKLDLGERPRERQRRETKKKMKSCLIHIINYQNTTTDDSDSFISFGRAHVCSLFIGWPRSRYIRMIHQSKIVLHFGLIRFDPFQSSWLIVSVQSFDRRIDVENFLYLCITHKHICCFSLSLFPFAHSLFEIIIRFRHIEPRCNSLTNFRFHFRSLIFPTDSSQ